MEIKVFSWIIEAKRSDRRSTTTSIIIINTITNMDITKIFLLENEYNNLFLIQLMVKIMSIILFIRNSNIVIQ